MPERMLVSNLMTGCNAGFSPVVVLMKILLQIGIIERVNNLLSWFC